MKNLNKRVLRLVTPIALMMIQVPSLAHANACQKSHMPNSRLKATCEVVLDQNIDGQASEAVTGANLCLYEGKNLGLTYIEFSGSFQQNNGYWIAAGGSGPVIRNARGETLVTASNINGPSLFLRANYSQNGELTFVQGTAEAGVWAATKLKCSRK